MRISDKDLDEIISNLLHERSERKICPEKRLIEIGIHLPMSKKLLDKHIKDCGSCQRIVEELWQESDEISQYKKIMWPVVGIAGICFAFLYWIAYDPSGFWDEWMWNRGK